MSCHRFYFVYSNIRILHPQLLCFALGVLCVAHLFAFATSYFPAGTLQEASNTGPNLCAACVGKVTYSGFGAVFSLTFGWRIKHISQRPTPLVQTGVAVLRDAAVLITLVLGGSEYNLAVLLFLFDFCFCGAPLCSQITAACIRGNSGLPIFSSKRGR